MQQAIQPPAEFLPEIQGNDAYRLLPAARMLAEADQSLVDRSISLRRDALRRTAPYARYLAGGIAFLCGAILLHGRVPMLSLAACAIGTMTTAAASAVVAVRLKPMLQGWRVERESRRNYALSVRNVRRLCYWSNQPVQIEGAPHS